MRLLALFILIASACHAQEYKKLRFGAGVGYGLYWPHFSNPDFPGFPFLGYYEPSYGLSDRITIGVRLETGFGNGTIVSSYGMNAQYYFSNEMFRPFGGLGLGIFHPSVSSSIDKNGFDTIYSSQEEAQLGFYPRLGFDYDHLAFTIEYNIVSSSKALIHNQLDQSVTMDHLTNSYLSIKLGVYFGGGVKK